MNRRHKLRRFLWLAVAVVHLLASLTFAHAAPWWSPAPADSHPVLAVAAEAQAATDCHPEADHRLSDCGVSCLHCAVCNLSGALIQAWSPERLTAEFLAAPPLVLAPGFPTPQLRPPRIGSA